MTNTSSKLAAAKMPKSQKRHLVPSIPLERSENKQPAKGEFLVMKCRTQPAEANSPTYDVTIPYFGSGTPEEWLRFRSNLDKVIHGQNATTGPSRYALARKLLEGDALAAFEQAATTTTGGETVVNFGVVMTAVTKHIFPARALQTQKRFMRRFLRKPKDMTIRQYVGRVQEMNSMLLKFPQPSNTQPATELPQDEILDLLEFGMPSTWQKAMIIQDFDPVSGTLADFTNFCERLERTESTEKISTKSIFSEKIRKKKRTREVAFKREEEKYCILHGEGNHSTEECYTIKKQVAKMKKFSKEKKMEGYHQKSKKAKKIFTPSFKKPLKRLTRKISISMVRI